MRTVIRGDDGFGSQMLCMFLGYLNSLRDSQEFCYTPIRQILLANKVGPSNKELNLLNSIIQSTMSNLGVPSCSQLTPDTPISVYNHSIYKDVNAGTFSQENLQMLQKSWPIQSPFENNTFNIVIHLRRGKDISKSESVRWTPSSYYDNLIPKLLVQYPEARIHTVSWQNPELKDFKSSRLINHISSEGDEILEHYNMMVHADMLFVCSSTFSASAGLFNKNIVFLDPTLMKLGGCPTPEKWMNDFRENKLKWNFNI